MGILEVAIASWVARPQPKMTADEFYEREEPQLLPRFVIAVLLFIAIIGAMDMVTREKTGPQMTADQSIDD